MRKTQRMASRLTAALGVAVLMTTVAAAPAAAGQAHVNPANGKLRQPTPAEAKAVADAFRALVSRSMRSAVANQVTEHADGSLSAFLGPETLNVWTVSVNADGSLHQMCVEGGNAVVQQGAPALEEK
jgi:hypothetical protein